MVFRDEGIQGMVFGCAAIYLLAFVVLRMRLDGTGRMGARWSASLPAEFWLGGLMMLAVLSYALDYSQAVNSTQALTLVGGVVLGQGAALWVGMVCLLASDLLPANGLNPVKVHCYFSNAHIEFPPHALGQKIHCPHCQRDITLKEPA